MRPVTLFLTQFGLPFQSLIDPMFAFIGFLHRHRGRGRGDHALR